MVVDLTRERRYVLLAVVLSDHDIDATSRQCGQEPVACKPAVCQEDVAFVEPIPQRSGESRILDV